MIFNKNITFRSVRVKAIVLDDSNKELFDLVGQWNGVGTIFYNEIDKPSRLTINQLPQARPYFSNIKNFPLVNEVVYLMLLADGDINDNLNSVTPYYISPINIWNHPNHNALPEMPRGGKEELPEEQKRDYELIRAGVVVRRVQDSTGTEIDLGRTFKESSTVNPLKSQEGDIQIEGRFGQSLNLTSNTESQSPVTILRTGQDPNKDPKQTPPWVCLRESINRDQNILLQSVDSKIDIQVKYQGKGLGETNLYTFNTYNLPQTILTSDRIVLSAKQDSVLINSGKLVNLYSNEKTYVEAKDAVVLDSNLVQLGGSNAEESVILGDNFLADMEKLTTSLTTALQQIGALLGNLGIPVAAPALGSLLDASVKAQAISTKINLKSYQSDKVKVSK